MIIDSVIAASISYIIMLIGFFQHHRPKIHVPIMVCVMIFDVLFPFYLYSTRDWKTRLIDHGDILSFGVWTHIGLLVALFVLYTLQISAGRRLLKADQTPRQEHRNIGKGILLTRALVLVSGILLIQKD